MAVTLSRIGQVKGAGATWGAGASGLDTDRALMLKLGSAEVMEAFMTATVFKGKTRERNIRGGKSVAFPITGKMTAAYHQPGTELTGTINDPSDLNERVISLDALMVADAAIYNVDELMSFFDVRQIYTKELGRALAVEYDKRVARMIFAAASNTTEPLNKTSNAGRIGQGLTLGTDYTASGATRQAKGDALVNAIFDARVGFETKDVSIDDMYAVFTPEDYYLISQSSRAINADFGGAGTIADGRTLRVAGIPILSSNHVTQSAYTLVAGDHNGDYAQNLSKCKGLIFNKEAVGVVSLLSPALQLTGEEWRVVHQADLMVARQALGMGVLRAESACKIVIP
ncbi:MAG: hypothetical protein CMQ74_07375 [Gammaproteobacteria bacterium]|nr:hypothetical protein [Gammaproteobacteria bacterium]|tara:strand:- start:279 stop:1304 length:1026 start_codon:yes stop_codon:yes gene_type:complete